MAEAAGAGSLRARLVLPLSLVVGVVIVGTLGYRWLWRDVGGTWLDGLFMTLTTITTIGYGEVKPLDGAGRIFTIADRHDRDRRVLLHVHGRDGAPRGGAAGGSPGEAQDGAADRGAGRARRRGGAGAGRAPGRRGADRGRHAVRRARSEPGGDAARRGPRLPPPGGRRHRGRGPRARRRAPGAGADRDHRQRRHQHVHRAVGAGPEPGAPHRRPRRRRDQRAEASPGGRRPRDQPLRHRRAPPGAPHPEPGRRRLLRDRAQAWPGGPGDRGRRAPPVERSDWPDARGALRAPGDGRLRAGGAPRGRARSRIRRRTSPCGRETAC